MAQADRSGDLSIHWNFRVIRNKWNTRKNGGAGDAGYTTAQGSSCSAAYVSGLAALMMAEQNVYPGNSANNLAPEDVEYLIKNYAKGAGSYSSDVGWGLIDAGNTMQHLDYPTYRVVHEGTSIAPSTATESVSYNNDINLLQTIYFSGATLPQREYSNAELYTLSASNTYTFPSTATVLAAWPRASSTHGRNNTTNVSLFDPNWYQDFTASISGNSVTINSTTYTYVVPYNGVDFILPTYPSNLDMEYSLLVYDPDYTGTNDTLNKVSRFVVYPNPASSYVKVAFAENESASTSLTIYDITGKAVKSLDFGLEAAGPYNKTVDISEIEPGVYFCTLIMGNESFTKKLVKVR